MGEILLSTFSIPLCTTSISNLNACLAVRYRFNVKKMMRLIWGLNRCINVNMHKFVHFKDWRNRIWCLNQFHFHGKWKILVPGKNSTLNMINDMVPGYYNKLCFKDNEYVYFSKQHSKVNRRIFMPTMCIYFYNYRCT